MTALDEYRKSVEFADRFDPMEALEKADAAIAELEAEVDKIRAEYHYDLIYNNRQRAERAEDAQRDRIVEYDVAREKWMRKKLADLRSRVRGK